MWGEQRGDPGWNGQRDAPWNNQPDPNWNNQFEGPWNNQHEPPPWGGAQREPPFRMQRPPHFRGPFPPHQQHPQFNQPPHPHNFNRFPPRFMQDDFPPRHPFERPPYPHRFDYPQGDFPAGEWVGQCRKACWGVPGMPGCQCCGSDRHRMGTEWADKGGLHPAPTRTGQLDFSVCTSSTVFLLLPCCPSRLFAHLKLYLCLLVSCGCCVSLSCTQKP